MIPLVKHRDDTKLYINTMEAKWRERALSGVKSSIETDEMERDLGWAYAEVGYLPRDRNAAINQRQSPAQQRAELPPVTVPQVSGTPTLSSSPPPISQPPPDNALPNQRIRGGSAISHAGDDPSDGPDVQSCVNASDGWTIIPESGQLIIDLDRERHSGPNCTAKNSLFVLRNVSHHQVRSGSVCGNPSPC